MAGRVNSTPDGSEGEAYYDFSTLVYDPLVHCNLSVVSNETGDNFCELYFDGVSCWYATPPDTMASQACPTDFRVLGHERAYRYCPPNGIWKDELTNYAECLGEDNDGGMLSPSNLKQAAEIMRDVYFILSLISLVLLVITLFIFQYFRSLQCSRISIHKNLVVSFILRFIVNIIIVQPFIADSKYSYRDVDWLCKVVTSLSQYTTLANIFWMFVEGLFLHNRLVVGVFSTEAPFKLFYFIGWGMPAIIILAWAITLLYLHDAHCWEDYSQTPYSFIITVPFILALGINLIFLVNIIRVLVSKLRANNRIESTNIRKAIKATVVLLPLLGLTNLLFFMSPNEDSGLKTAYHVTNAALHSSQGIFVSVLYCFLNGEVRRVVKQKWYRFKIRHVLHRNPGRRRSSRTSSFFLSQTEDPTGDSANPDRSKKRPSIQPAAQQLLQLRSQMANDAHHERKEFNANQKENNVNHIGNGSNNNVDGFFSLLDQRETVL